MAKNQTAPTTETVESFLNGVQDPKRRADAIELCALMTTATGATPTMWGSSIIGFGTHAYRYETGRTGVTVAVGLSPRKQALVLYGLLCGTEWVAELGCLGPHTVGKGCVYIKSLATINHTTLSGMVTTAYALLNTAP